MNNTEAMPKKSTSYFCLNLGQTAEDSDMFTIIWLSSRGCGKVHMYPACKKWPLRKKYSPIHEIADANITCDFGDGCNV